MLRTLRRPTNLEPHEDPPRPCPPLRGRTAPRGGAGLADRGGRRRSGAPRRRRRRDGDQPDHRQRRRRRRRRCARAPVANARAPGAGAPRSRRARPSSASTRTGASRPSGRRGPTASRCASSTSTTPSWPPSTRTRATTSRRSSRSPSTAGSSGADLVRGHRDRLRDPGRPGAGHLPARAQDRPRRPPRPVGRRRHRHRCWACDAETIYQAVGQALHITTATRQSRKGEISSWKAYAPGLRRQDGGRGRRPGHARRGRARPRSTRARTASSRGCSTARTADYAVPLPEPGEAKRAILDTYTKEHSAEYQAQALIDLAAAHCAPRIGDLGRRRVEVRDPHQPPHPQRDRDRRERPAEVRTPPRAARPSTTRSRTSSPSRCRTARGTTSARTRPTRAGRPDTVALWQHDPHGGGSRVDPALPRPGPGEKAFGGRIVVTLDDGTVIEDELAVADAHPLRRAPVRPRSTTSTKFRTLADGVVAPAEQRALPGLRRRARSSWQGAELAGLTVRRRSGAPRPGHAARDLRPMSCSDAVQSRPTPAATRAELRRALGSGRLLRFPGAFSPLVAMADRGRRLRGRLHLRRGPVRRPRAARHRPHHAHRGRHPGRGRSPASPSSPR